MEISIRYVVKYLDPSGWIFAKETMFEDEAVEYSRLLWKKRNVRGVKVLKTETSVHKEARKK